MMTKELKAVITRVSSKATAMPAEDMDTGRQSGQPIARARASPPKEKAKGSPKAVLLQDNQREESKELKEEVKEEARKEPKAQVAKARADRVGTAVPPNTIRTIARRTRKPTEAKLTCWRMSGPMMGLPALLQATF